MDVTNSDNVIAVIWGDGSQECKILNVSPRHNDEVSDESVTQRTACAVDVSDENIVDIRHDGIYKLISQGIDNVAFDKTTTSQSNSGMESRTESTLTCSSSSYTTCTASGSGTNSRSSEQPTFNRTSIRNTSRCSSSRSSFKSTSNRSNENFSHDNPAFETPSELSYDAVVKHSPVHPNVYLVRKRSTENGPSLCMCPTNDVIVQVRPTDLPDNVLYSANNETEGSESRLHFLQRGPSDPVCSVHLTEITNENDNKKDDIDSTEPPPNYSSLRFMFLEDEPPKYQQSLLFFLVH